MQRSTLTNDKRVPGARRLRRDMTDPQRTLWRLLRGLSLRGTHFRRQAPIGPFFADFACRQRRLIIEVDGGQHNDADQIARDPLRTQYLEARGYRVLPF